MMIYPGEDGFITAVQEGRVGTVTVTASDDLVIVIGRIKEVLAPAGIEPRVFIAETDTLNVVAR